MSYFFHRPPAQWPVLRLPANAYSLTPQKSLLANLLKGKAHFHPPPARGGGQLGSSLRSCIHCGKSNTTRYPPPHYFFTSRKQNKFFFKQILGVCWQICLKKNLFCIHCGISNHISISPSNLYSERDFKTDLKNVDIGYRGRYQLVGKASLENKIISYGKPGKQDEPGGVCTETA